MINNLKRIMVATILATASIVVHAEEFSKEARNFVQVAATQKTPVWCWAAVIESILNYQGIPIKQAEVVVSVKGPNGLAFPSTANMFEFQRALIGWKRTFQGVPYSLDLSLHTSGVAPALMLMNSFDKQHLAIVGIQGRHVAVAYKAAFTRKAGQDPELVSITYFDPWDGLSKTVRPGTREFSDITDTWIGWVAAPKDRTF